MTLIFGITYQNGVSSKLELQDSLIYNNYDFADAEPSQSR